MLRLDAAEAQDKYLARVRNKAIGPGLMQKSQESALELGAAGHRKRTFLVLT
jgi:hypothetical protein